MAGTSYYQGDFLIGGHNLLKGESKGTKNKKPAPDGRFSYLAFIISHLKIFVKFKLI